MTTRRGFLAGLGALFIGAAPAIVRVENIMPVKVLPDVEILNEALEYGVVPENLYAELCAVIRKAFIPRLYVQLYHSSPLILSEEFWTANE